MLQTTVEGCGADSIHFSWLKVKQDMQANSADNHLTHESMIPGCMFEPQYMYSNGISN